MWIYFLIYIIICFFCLANIKQQNWVLFILLVILIIFAGFRGPIDKDYLSYTFYYNQSIKGHSSIEFSFLIISRVVNFIFGNFKFLIFIYALIGVSLKFLAIKKLTDLWIYSVLIYFSYYYFLQEMTQIRAGVAISFVLLGIAAIEEKNFKKFILLSTIGVLFHYSAIIILPFYFLGKDKMQSYYYFLIPLGYIFYFLNVNISSFIHMIHIDAISVRFDYYKQRSNQDSINVFNFWQMGRCLFSGMLLWKWKTLQENNKFAILLIKYYIIGSFLFVAFADIPALGFRASDIFASVEFILVPFIIYFFTNKNRQFGKIVVCLIGLIMLTMVLFYAKIMKPYF